MDMTKHPWQNGPVELINYGLFHLNQSSKHPLTKEADFEQRIAFLLLDVGVETLFKTFLLLPERTTGTKLGYGDRKKAAEGTFHELCGGIERAAGSRLQGIDITYVEFFHDLRNKLYHEGNGITIPTYNARTYAQIAVNLLVCLLEVDLSDELQKLEFEEQNAER